MRCGLRGQTWQGVSLTQQSCCHLRPEGLQLGAAMAFDSVPRPMKATPEYDLDISDAREAVTELMQERGFISPQKVLYATMESPQLHKLAPPMQRLQSSSSRGKMKIGLPSAALGDELAAKTSVTARSMLQEGTLTHTVRKAVEGERDQMIETLHQQKLMEGQQDASRRYVQLTHKLNDLGIFDHLTNQVRDVPHPGPNTGS